LFLYPPNLNLSVRSGNTGEIVRILSARSLFQVLIGSVLALNSGCAHKTAPGGGPVDKIRPVVLSIFPASDSIRVSTDLKAITLRFSEVIDAQSVQNSIFISPPIDFEIVWKNDQVLDLLFSDTLQQNKTYVITVAASVQDLRRNKLSGSFQSAFSTGDSIDTGIVFGNVRLLDPRQILTILAFPSSQTGTENWYQQPPDYIAQTNENGRFSLSNLKLQSYRLLAISDKDMDYQLNPFREYFGIAPAEIKLTKTQPMQGPLNFQLSVRDTVKPKLTGMRLISDRQVRLRFNKKVLLQYIRKAHFNIFPQDSVFVPESFGYNSENPSSVEIYLPRVTKADSIFFTMDSLADSLGNTSYFKNVIHLPFTGKPDTTSAGLIKYFPSHKSKNVQQDVSLGFNFNHPLIDSVFTDQINISSSAGEIPGKWSHPDPGEWRFAPDEQWAFGDTIEVRMDSVNVTDLWGNPVKIADSVFTFSIISENELGSMAGQFRSVWKKDNYIILRVRKLGGKKLIRSAGFYLGSTFSFSWLPEGKYLIDGFWDKNRNGLADTGLLWPYTPAEWIFSHPDTISIRKRWETSDIILTLPEISEE